MNSKIYQQQRNYYKNNPRRRLSQANYTKFNHMFRNLVRWKRDEVFLMAGCTLRELSKHFEKQFHSGMTWKNYGKKWQVDHIDPLSMFDLSNKDQILACWHYTNLRPILKADNRKKWNGLALRH